MPTEKSTSFSNFELFNSFYFAIGSIFFYISVYRNLLSASHLLSCLLPDGNKAQQVNWEVSQEKDSNLLCFPVRYFSYFVADECCVDDAAFLKNKQSKTQEY